MPNWIEVISGWAPDRRDGTVEMMIVLVVILALALAGAWREARS
jgi:hypothetical protein